MIDPILLQVTELVSPELLSLSDYVTIGIALVIAYIAYQATTGTTVNRCCTVLRTSTCLSTAYRMQPPDGIVATERGRFGT